MKNLNNLYECRALFKKVIKTLLKTIQYKHLKRMLFEDGTTFFYIDDNNYFSSNENDCIAVKFLIYEDKELIRSTLGDFFDYNKNKFVERIYPNKDDNIYNMNFIVTNAIKNDLKSLLKTFYKIEFFDYSIDFFKENANDLINDINKFYQ